MEEPTRFHVDRVDFILGGQYCNFCHRELKSRIAFIIRDQDGKEFLSGPTCLSTRALIDPKKGALP